MGRAIVSGGQNENREIAASVGAPLGIVNHVLDDLEGEGLAEVDSSLGGGNLDLFMNSLNWLLQREQLMAVSPKVPDEFRLDMSPSQQHAVYMLVIGGLPLFVAIIGIVVWLSRRK